jgi:hypothetical protein
MISGRCWCCDGSRSFAQAKPHAKSRKPWESAGPENLGVHAPTQGRTRGYYANAQDKAKEGIAPEDINCIEVVLALHQQAR